MAKKRSTKRKDETHEKFMMGLGVGAFLAVLAVVFTVVLQGSYITTSSDASRGKWCGQTCRRDSQCQSGLTCEKDPNTRRKICTCPNGTCIARQCKEVGGDAVAGEECDLEQTTAAQRGRNVDLPSLACESGLQCTFVTRLAGGGNRGSSYVCCDPTLPDDQQDPRCISDPIRKVAPNP